MTSTGIWANTGSGRDGLVTVEDVLARAPGSENAGAGRPTGNPSSMMGASLASPRSAWSASHETNERNEVTPRRSARRPRSPTPTRRAARGERRPRSSAGGPSAPTRSSRRPRGASRSAALFGHRPHDLRAKLRPDLVEQHAVGRRGAHFEPARPSEIHQEDLAHPSRTRSQQRDSGPKRTRYSARAG